MDKKRILVVDDDTAILRLLSTNLKARGYEASIKAMDIAELVAEAVETNTRPNPRNPSPAAQPSA